MIATTMTTRPPTAPTTAPPIPEPGRVRAALRALGNWIVEGLATENGWCWGLSYGCPVYPPRYRMRSDPPRDQACAST